MTHYSIESTEWHVDMNDTVVLDVVEIRETNDFDDEYLNEELVEDCIYEITDNRIKIETPSTCVIKENKGKYIDVNDTLKSYRKLLKLCKQNKIKIGYTNHYKKLLSENKVAYYEEVENANILFDKMREVALQVQSRGIHYGCNDDKVLNYLHLIKSKYQACHYRSTLLSVINEINTKINNYIEDIEKGYESYSKLYL